MGLLGDFAGAFATNIGNEMYQNEQEQRAIALQEALEQRRIQREQERELRQRRNQNEDRATELNLQGPQVGIDDQGKQALLRVRAEVDPETAAIRGTRERVGDAPVTPVGRPMTIYDGPNRRSVQRYSDGSEQDLGAPSPVRAASGGSSASTKVRTVTNSDGSKTDYDPSTGKELKHFPAKGGGGSKPADKEKARETYMKDRAFIRDAQSVDELTTYLTSIGAKVPARDSQEVLNAPVNQEDDHYLGVLRDVAAKAADARVTGGKAGSDAPAPKAKTDAPPVAGATKAPDGNWYIQKNGKWFKVEA